MLQWPINPAGESRVVVLASAACQSRDDVPLELSKQGVATIGDQQRAVGSLAQAANAIRKACLERGSISSTTRAISSKGLHFIGVDVKRRNSLGDAGQGRKG